MTAALLLLMLSLSALHVALNLDAAGSTQRVFLAIAGFANLPMSFGPFVPISHFVFEATGRGMLLVSQGIVAVLLVTLAMRLTRQRRRLTESGSAISATGLLICQTVWLASAFWLSDYEPGARTPDVWDAPVYVLDWLAAIIACMLIAVAGWRAAGPGIVCRGLTAGYLLLVSTLVVATLGT